MKYSENDSSLRDFDLSTTQNKIQCFPGFKCSNRIRMNATYSKPWLCTFMNDSLDKHYCMIDVQSSSVGKVCRGWTVVEKCN